MAEASSTSSFVMHGARTAIAGGMQHIGVQVKSIESAIDENQGFAFDLAKTLIESVCKTILNERKIAYGTNDDLPKLFKTVVKNLPLLPKTASDETKVRKSLAQTLGGLHSAVQGICELRNACGFASHGGDENKPTMESVQAILAAESADAIVGFLFRVHSQKVEISGSVTVEFEDNSTFNDRVDEIHPMVQIFDNKYRPSEVLFRVDQVAYQTYLSGFEPEPEVVP
jgi:hypothetical protein